MGALEFFLVLTVIFPCAFSFSCMPCEDRDGCITIPKGSAAWDATQQEWVILGETHTELFKNVQLN
jgi:hypothetical protein